jgi:DNA-binding transcriptional LysR family regulator
MKRDTPLSPAAPPPSLEALQALLSFVEAGGVAAAAETLELPQPTMSRRLQVFQRRDSQGEAILARRGRNLRLTEKGHAALPAICELVRQYDQLNRFLNGAPVAVRVVRLGIGSFGAQHYLPRALAELRRRKVTCEIETELARGQDRIRGVVEGRFDMALVTHDPRQIQMIVSASSNPKAKLAVEPVTMHAFCVLAKLGTPLASELRAVPANRPVPLELLSRGEFVGLDPQSGIRLQLESEFHKLGRPLQFVRETAAGGWAAAKEYTRHGLGPAIIPHSALAAGDDLAFAIRRLPERFAVTDYLIRRKLSADAAEPELVLALRHASRQHLKEVQELFKGVSSGNASSGQP